MPPLGAAQSEGGFTMTRKLTGKVALVTGGSAGIGLGIAKCCAEEGAHVFITGRRESELDRAVTAIGSNAAAVQGDISNRSDFDRIFATIKDKAGHVVQCLRPHQDGVPVGCCNISSDAKRR